MKSWRLYSLVIDSLCTTKGTLEDCCKNGVKISKRHLFLEQCYAGCRGRYGPLYMCGNTKQSAGDSVPQHVSLPLLVAFFSSWRTTALECCSGLTAPKVPYHTTMLHVVPKVMPRSRASLLASRDDGAVFFFFSSSFPFLFVYTFEHLVMCLLLFELHNIL